VENIDLDDRVPLLRVENNDLDGRVPLLHAENIDLDALSRFGARRKRRPVGETQTRISTEP
jgi:hypothetical protein